MKEPQPRRAPPVFFLDRNLGHRDVATALRQAGAAVEEHHRHFAPDAADVEWLSVVGELGWAAITQDDRIRYRQAEKVAALSSGLPLFIFTGRKMKATEIGTALVAALPAMTRFLSHAKRPFIARVTRSGQVVRIV